MHLYRTSTSARDQGSEWSSLTGSDPGALEGAVRPASAGYRLLRCIADGRRSCVWRARHQQHGAVALKLARATPASYGREFDLARSLAHPNVLHVVEQGSAGGVAYPGLNPMDSLSVTFSAQTSLARSPAP